MARQASLVTGSVPAGFMIPAGISRPCLGPVGARAMHLTPVLVPAASPAKSSHFCSQVWATRIKQWPFTVLYGMHRGRLYDGRPLLTKAGALRRYRTALLAR